MVESTFTPIASNSDVWFDELIATLQTHQFMLDTNTANKELKNLYNLMMGGNSDEIAHHGKQLSQKHFILNIILDYLSIVKNQKPLKLAFDYNDSEVLVWAEIGDDNEELEKQLYLAEAQINAKYHQYGFDMTSMIVEKNDRATVPNHYKMFTV